MTQTTYHGRRAASIENARLRVTVLHGGGHIAEILHKDTGINPLWVPPWTSIDPSGYAPTMHPEYGSGTEARLLAGIMGHNLCLDIFGGPSPEEAEAGITVHGEGSVVDYEIVEQGGELVQRACLPLAQMRFERTIALEYDTVRIRETVENLAAADRPIGWTQHVTLGPPFLEKGVTQFRASATRSKVFETDFGADAYLASGAEFDWPIAPRSGHGIADLRTMNDAAASSAFTTHLMDPQRENAFFVAFAPQHKLAFAYVWKRSDFPWLGIWEEDHSRKFPPWSGNALARGMEFGVSPMPESRRQMIERGALFGVPAYRWLPAKGRVRADYRVRAWTTAAIPESID
jgi:hypothetical protein